MEYFNRQVSFRCSYNDVDIFLLTAIENCPVIIGLIVAVLSGESKQIIATDSAPFDINTNSIKFVILLCEGKINQDKALD